MKKYNIKKFIAGISTLCVMAQALPVMSSAVDILYGDANEDGETNVADAVLIMQSLSNPNEYKLTETGLKLADVVGNGDGVTAKDALVIQMVGINLVSASDLPLKEDIII